MALPIDTIEKILNTNGKLWFNGANAYNPYGSGFAASVHHKVYPNHILCSHAIGNNELTLFGLPENQHQGATAINIAYMGDWFTFGKIPPAPPCVCSDGFARCSFYLFRTMMNDIFAVLPAARPARSATRPSISGRWAAACSGPGTASMR